MTYSWSGFSVAALHRSQAALSVASHLAKHHLPSMVLNKIPNLFHIIDNRSTGSVKLVM